MDNDTVTLYRAIGPEEIGIIKENDYKKMPPRLLGQPTFYPVTNESYAKRVALDTGIGYVTKFEVKKSFMDLHCVTQVDSDNPVQWLIVPEDIKELNENIVGVIEVISEYRK